MKCKRFRGQHQPLSNTKQEAIPWWDLAQSLPWVCISCSQSKEAIAWPNDAWHLETQNKWGSLETYTPHARTCSLQVLQIFSKLAASFFSKLIWAQQTFKNKPGPAVAQSSSKRGACVTMTQLDEEQTRSSGFIPCNVLISLKTKFQVVTSNIGLASSAQLRNRVSGYAQC